MQVPYLERDMSEMWLRGEKAQKYVTCSHLPIPVRHHGETTGPNEGTNETNRGNNFEHFIGDEKKRDPHLLPELVEQLWQAQVSPPLVAGAGPDLTIRK